MDKADVAESVYAADLKSADESHGGSSPPVRTNDPWTSLVTNLEVTADEPFGKPPTLRSERTIEKVWGPYTYKYRGSPRKYLVCKYSDGKLGSITYARHLMQEKLGRRLEDWEEVDHIDGDCCNDDISNLQIIESEENKLKYSGGRKARVALRCALCDKAFYRDLKHETHRHKRKGRGPYCSVLCANRGRNK